MVTKKKKKSSQVIRLEKLVRTLGLDLDDAKEKVERYEKIVAMFDIDKYDNPLVCIAKHIEGKKKLKMDILELEQSVSNLTHSRLEFKEMLYRVLGIDHENNVEVTPNNIHEFYGKK